MNVANHELQREVRRIHHPSFFYPVPLMNVSPNASTRVCETHLDGTADFLGTLIGGLGTLWFEDVIPAVSRIFGRSDAAGFRRSRSRRYLSESLRVCNEAYLGLIADGIVEPGDVIRLGPLAECFRRWPPNIRVTQSEVISILVRKEAVERWTRSGCLAAKLTAITARVQTTSAARTSSVRFRTYVLIHMADGETAVRGRRRNSLIGLHFQETMKPNLLDREATERHDLIERLCYLNNSDIVRGAYSHASEDFVGLERVLRSLASRKVAGSVYDNRAKDFVIGLGLVSLMGLISAVVALCTIDLARSHQLLLAIIAFCSTLGLMAAGEGADEILVSDETGTHRRPSRT